MAWKYLKPRNMLILGFALFFVAGILAGCLSLTWVDYTFGTDVYDDWTVTAEPESGTVVYSACVGDALAGKTLCVHVLDSFVTVRAGETELYRYGASMRFMQSPGSLYHMFRIPAEAAGKLLTVEIRTAYADRFVTDFEFLAGSYGELVLRCLGADLADLLASLVLVVFAAVLLMLYGIASWNGNGNESALYLGLLPTAFVLWSLGNRYVNQLLFPNAVVRYYVYYFALYAMPLLMVGYMKTLCRGVRFHWFFCAYSLLCAVLCLLHFTGIAEMTQTLTWFFLLGGAELAAAVLVFFRRVKKGYRDLEFGLYVFLLSVLVNIGFYMAHPASWVQVTVAKLGLSVYLAAALWHALLSIVSELANAHNAELLKVQAYTDSMSRLGNRYAFDETIQNTPLETMTLISMDINNLKECNDTHSHVCGDQMIGAAADILRDTFDTVFRTGGDEFVAILKSPGHAQLEEIIRRIHERSSAVRIVDMPLQIACGSASYRESDTSYEDILRRADARMYEDKRKLKENA